ncbi:hypothetical protein H4219_003796 [Mycoemilia scoparia]|uniref:BTB domain-containing protein n=1 Tax=Mycoemilia scoparia TaxID=417184 RepID=A0A9W8DMD3_9FUNG|nr:hypothetical protein H4219_003796 [Mycoemilia scoparia]
MQESFLNPTSLYIKNIQCTGDVPPPLIGCSLTYMGSHAYLFGGRTFGIGALSGQVYACDLKTFIWKKVGPDVPTRRPQSSPLYPRLFNNSSVSKAGIDDAPFPTAGKEDIDEEYATADGEENDDDEPDASPQSTPYPRFFHTATAYKHYVIIFGGMSLTYDKSIRCNIKVILNDIAFFDTKSGTWHRPDDLKLKTIEPASQPHNGGPGRNSNQEGSTLKATGSETQLNGSSGGSGVLPSAGRAPSPRYAHLSTIVSDEYMIIVGGQDHKELYVEEMNIFNLKQMRWLEKHRFPRSVGMYRTMAIPTSSNSVYLYSNYNFNSVRRSMHVLGPPPELKVTDMSSSLKGDVLPPGLRFPIGLLLDENTMLLAGTFILGGVSHELSIWICNLRDFSWRRIPCARQFMQGSWNQAIINPLTNEYIAFGDSSRSMSQDYQRRRLNFKEVKVVDIKAFGYIPRIPKSPTYDVQCFQESVDKSKASREFLKSSQDLGFFFHTLGQFVDCELVAADGERFFINSGMLKHRLPMLSEKWLNPQNSRKSLYGYRVVLPYNKFVIHPLVQYIYTYPLDVPSISQRPGNTDPDTQDQPSSSNALPAPVEDGGLSTPMATLINILVAASQLEIEDVVDEVAAIIHSRISPENATQVFHSALLSNNNQLQAHAVIALLENKEFLIQKPEVVFGNFPKQSEKTLFSYIAPTLKSDPQFMALFDIFSPRESVDEGHDGSGGSANQQPRRNVYATNLSALAKCISELYVNSGQDDADKNEPQSARRNSKNSSIMSTTNTASFESQRIWSPNSNIPNSPALSQIEAFAARSKMQASGLKGGDKGTSLDHLKIPKSGRRRSSVNSQLSNEIVSTKGSRETASRPSPLGERPSQHNSATSTSSTSNLGPRVPSTIIEEHTSTSSDKGTKPNQLRRTSTKTDPNMPFDALGEMMKRYESLSQSSSLEISETQGSNKKSISSHLSGSSTSIPEPPRSAKLVRPSTSKSLQYNRSKTTPSTPTTPPPPMPSSPSLVGSNHQLEAKIKSPHLTSSSSNRNSLLRPFRKVVKRISGATSVTTTSAEDQHSIASASDAGSSLTNREMTILEHHQPSTPDTPLMGSISNNRTTSDSQSFHTTSKESSASSSQTESQSNEKQKSKKKSLPQKTNNVAVLAVAMK